MTQGFIQGSCSSGCLKEQNLHMSTGSHGLQDMQKVKENIKATGSSKKAVRNDAQGGGAGSETAAISRWRFPRFRVELSQFEFDKSLQSQTNLRAAAGSVRNQQVSFHSVQFNLSGFPFVCRGCNSCRGLVHPSASFRWM